MEKESLGLRTIIEKISSIESNLNEVRIAITGDLSKENTERSILHRLSELEISHRSIRHILVALFLGFIITGIKTWFFNGM